ncbi:MAG: PEP-CTERM sorting domain-containing protein [Microcystis flos-aquae DF17]|nr:MAG: PEP-CTERM sorting domain-containing protein [Microcystis flos-aquae DF17]
MYWAIDDFLGQFPGFPDPNPIGVYINGHALGSSFSGAGYASEYSASQSIPSNWLNPGSNNWLYVYQRDAADGVSGAIFGAHISVNVPEPSSIIGLAVLSTLGAASTLKRQIKSSKPSEKETTKVG